MPILFPVVRGRQRNQEFFQTVMDYGEIADLVKLPEDVLGDELFDKDETIQRELNWNRVRTQLVPYLENDDAFYSALTLVMIPRDFSELREDEGYEFKSFDPSDPTIENVGRLVISSAIYLFPCDGQHRVASIKEYLKKRGARALDKVPVVLLPFRNKPATRQMFSDLNLNAKPPSKTIGLSFETRDPLAVMAKEVEKRIPLLNGRVNHQSNSLPKTSPNVITMNTLYEVTKSVMEAVAKVTGEPDLLAKIHGLPTDEPAFAAAINKAADVWQVMVDSLPMWKGVETGAVKASDIRSDYIVGYGVGWQAIGKAVSEIILANPASWHTAIPVAVTKIDWTQKNGDWQNVCMIGHRVNNTGPAVKATAGYILDKAGFDQAKNPFYGNWKNSLAPAKKAEVEKTEAA